VSVDDPIVGDPLEDDPPELLTKKITPSAMIATPTTITAMMPAL